MTVYLNSRRFIFCLVAAALCSAPAYGDLIHRYSFNDGTAKDSVGNVDGALKGGATIANGSLVLANQDKSSGDAGVEYVEFSGPIIPKSGSASLVFWFTAKDCGAYSRIFNVSDREGAEGRAYLYFTPRNADDQSRTAITATDAAGKTAIDGDRLDDGKEHMVAVVIDGATKKLRVFVDGKEPVAAQDLGANTLDKVRPVYNWLGRSAFDQDAALTGSINEFRVYDEALNLEQATAIFKAGPDALP